MKKAEEKQQVIYGAPNLENFFHRSYISIVSIRENYGLPIKKRGGFPSIDMDEWREWAMEYGLDPEQPADMKASALQTFYARRELEKLPDATLTGFDKISDFLHRAQVDVQEWVKQYSDFPVTFPVDGKDKSRRATASTRQLRLWLYAKGLRLVPGEQRQGASQAQGQPQWKND